jgi:AcrR family transcriptional regulator
LAIARDIEPPQWETPSARAEREEQQGLGVRSPFPHKLHPTAQKILAAAMHILTEDGYEAMTLQAIAKEAHANKAGVWYHFGGKQQLLDALLEEVLIHESRVFGAMPPADATLADRIDLVVGSAGQVGERVPRFAAFYELLPQASRDESLHEHLKLIYQAWYDWVTYVLSAPVDGSPTYVRPPSTIAQFASVLLDGIFLQMVVGAPGFYLEAALENARLALTNLVKAESVPTPELDSMGVGVSTPE